MIKRLLIITVTGCRIAGCLLLLPVTVLLVAGIHLYACARGYYRTGELREPIDV